jgi:hypothetical protein
MQKFASAVLALAAVSWSGVASAQVFGNRGDAAFGAERLMGVHSDHVFQDPAVPGNPGREYDVTTFGLGFFGHAAATPFDLPRIAFDYFIADHWSLGGSLAYQTTDVTVSNGHNGPADAGSDDGAEFLFSPRVGYAHMFGRVVGIWPRAGLTYHSETVNNGYNINGFGLGLEAQFVFVPAQHFAILLGPSLDLDFTGNMTPNQGSEVGHGYRSIGLQVGLLGWI